MTTHPSIMTGKAALVDLVQEALDKHIASSISLNVCDTSKTDITIHQGLVSPGLMTNSNTIYDLASLTKILGTTVAVAKAIHDGMIDLDESPFSAWPHGSIRTLLAHTAGLPAHKHFYKDLTLSDHDFQKNRQLIEQALWQIPNPKTTERVYSDLGFIALGFLLEERLKKPLFTIFSEAWAALNCADSFIWYPSHLSPEDSPQVAKTFCHVRNLSRRAQVHDANCHFLGGLAGHAGLFGNLATTAGFGTTLLRCYKKPQNSLEQIIAQFAKEGLGFDKPTPNGSNYCLSPDAFGHFGYTGVSLWIDPAVKPNGIVITLLTNRINESDTPEGIFWLRKAVNEAVIRDLLS